MRLFYHRGDSRIPRIVTTICMVGLDCEMVPITDHDMSTIGELRVLSPLGLTPIFQAEGVALCTVGSILKHVAKVRREKGYAGLLLREETQVLFLD